MYQYLRKTEDIFLHKHYFTCSWYNNEIDANIELLMWQCLYKKVDIRFLSSIEEHRPVRGTLIRDSWHAPLLYPDIHSEESRTPSFVYPENIPRYTDFLETSVDFVLNELRIQRLYNMSSQISHVYLPAGY